MEIPQYQIKAELGKGGMATVYLAVQKSLGREVALKVMSPVLVADQDFRQRFLKEAQIIGQLNHHNIITVYDIGAQESIFYMALEYAPHGSLRQRIKEGIDIDQALFILKQIARALQYAHANGVIHRDVNSANILFRNPKTPVLSDFGVAKAVTSSARLTRAGVTVGTPHYMSPEQAKALPITAQSDFYSLGIVFYEMLIGECPYQVSAENTPFSILLKHINDPVPTLPAPFSELQPLIDRLLAKEPDQRFATSGELLEAIDEAEANRATALDRLAPPTLVIKEPAAEQTRIESGQAEHSATVAAATPRTPRKRTRLALAGGLTLVALAASAALYLQLNPDPLAPPNASRLLVRDFQQLLNIEQRQQALAQLASTYQDVLALEPQNTVAANQLDRIADKYLELARLSWDHLDHEQSLTLIEQGLDLTPEHPGLLALRQSIVSDPPNELAIERWLAEAEQHFAAQRFVLPLGYNAVEAYLKVLQIDPQQAVALRRLDEMATFFEQAARAELAAGNYDDAVSNVEQGLLIMPNHSALLDLRQQLLPQPQPNS